MSTVTYIRAVASSIPVIGLPIHLHNSLDSQDRIETVLFRRTGSSIELLNDLLEERGIYHTFGMVGDILTIITTVALISLGMIGLFAIPIASIAAINISRDLCDRNAEKLTQKMLQI